MRITRALPLYGFLRACSQTDLEKKVLDCGAGGDHPPLALFYEAGYETHGIELSKTQLAAAEAYALQEGMDFQLVEGSMCRLPYEDQSFSFLYSWNTTVHMDKDDVFHSLVEFQRVLKPGGLCYINFLSHASSSYGIGEEIAEGVFQVPDGDAKIQFSHYTKAEIESHFDKFEVIAREERIISRYNNGVEMVSGFYDYILKRVEDGIS